MIKPTIGRVVHFWPFNPRMMIEQPRAAIVAFVHDDERTVNLGVLDHFGNVYSELNVPLLQADEEKPVTGGYAEWMPYQIGQAAKTDELAKALEAASGNGAEANAQQIEQPTAADPAEATGAYPNDDLAPGAYDPRTGDGH